MHNEALIVTAPDMRLLTMFISWTIAFYGVYRRDSKGTIAALAGLGLSLCALAGVHENT
jgi:hypothetical protein